MNCCVSSRRPERRRPAAFWVAICLAAFYGAGLHCRAQETGKVQFLTFRLTNSVLVLAKSSVVAGTLKPSPVEATTSGLRVVLEDKPDGALWALRIAEPTTRRLEYEDPARPGVIQHKIVAVENTEFMVRAPYFKEARSVAVFREAAAPAGAAKAVATGRVLLLRATLPASDAR